MTSKSSALEKSATTCAWRSLSYAPRPQPSRSRISDIHRLPSLTNYIEWVNKIKATIGEHSSILAASR
ncbi:MAG: hypothetical protein QOE55_316 [Acidobacteriaceae bacterium]|nr:hypothetical protein [Acidobacteriaceae bacterium]